MADVDADVAVVGAGAAGLSLVLHLLTAGPPGLRIALVEQPAGAAGAPGARTWCWWERPGGLHDEALRHSWPLASVRCRDGAEIVVPLGPLRYKMLRSDALERRVDALVARTPGARRVTAQVCGITEDGDTVRLELAPGGINEPVLRARWVFDSRPLPLLPPARTTLLQHFRGWFVRSERPVFDPGRALLMDFRTPQPPPGGGLAFGYVLPWSAHEALVEYTRFDRRPLDRASYDRELGRFCAERWGLRPGGGDWRVTGAEQGVIPMTDARFPVRAGRRVFRIGVAGGAARPATGYAFAAMQRQSAAIAAALAAGAPPVPPRPHGARHLAMDAALLRALDRGRIAGADFFERLFRDNPPDRLLRFLDGTSSRPEELALGLRCPVLPMALSCAELPFLRRTVTPWAPPDENAAAPPAGVRRG